MTKNYTFDQIMSLIAEERNRQDAKWGTKFPGRDDNKWVVILGEEFGELCNAILEDDQENILVESIQCAAVLFSFLEHRQQP